MWSIRTSPSNFSVTFLSPHYSHPFYPSADWNLPFWRFEMVSSRCAGEGPAYTPTKLDRVERARRNRHRGRGPAQSTGENPAPKLNLGDPPEGSIPASLDNFNASRKQFSSRKSQSIPRERQPRTRRWWLVWYGNWWWWSWGTSLSGNKVQEVSQAKLCSSKSELSSTAQWNAGLPRMLAEIQIGHIRAGVICRSRDSALIAFCQYSEMINRRHCFKSLKSVPSNSEGDDGIPAFPALQNALCMKARCMTDQCHFRIVIRRQDNGEWKVERLSSHDCELPIASKRLGTTAYSARMLADTLVPCVSSGRSLTSKDIKQILQSYLRAIPTSGFIHTRSRYHESARDPAESLSRLPSYIAKLIDLGHIAKILTKTAQESVDIAVQIARKEHERENRELSTNWNRFGVCVGPVRLKRMLERYRSCTDISTVE